MVDSGCIRHRIAIISGSTISILGLFGLITAEESCHRLNINTIEKSPRKGTSEKLESPGDNNFMLRQQAGINCLGG